MAGIDGKGERTFSRANFLGSGETHGSGCVGGVLVEKEKMEKSLVPEHLQQKAVAWGSIGKAIPRVPRAVQGSLKASPPPRSSSQPSRFPIFSFASCSGGAWSVLCSR